MIGKNAHLNINHRELRKTTETCFGKQGDNFEFSVSHESNLNNGEEAGLIPLLHPTTRK